MMILGGPVGWGLMVVVTVATTESVVVVVVVEAAAVVYKAYDQSSNGVPKGKGSPLGLSARFW